MKNKKRLCPCQSNKNYTECCQPFHQGNPPLTPIELMRARYSAYALKNVRFIIETTHPSNKEFQTNTKKWNKKLLNYIQTITFISLEILPLSKTPSNPFLQGLISFRILFTQDSKPLQVMEETSLFERKNTLWLYKEALNFRVFHMEHSNSNNPLT